MKIFNKDIIFISGNFIQKEEKEYYFVKVLVKNDSINDYDYYMLNDKDLYNLCKAQNFKALDLFKARCYYTVSNNRYYLHVLELA